MHSGFCCFAFRADKHYYESVLEIECSLSFFSVCLILQFTLPVTCILEKEMSRPYFSKSSYENYV